MRTSKDFRDYQRSAVEKAIIKKQLAVLLKPGLGKTAVTLKAISYLKKKFQAKGEKFKVLIVAPIFVCTDVWRQEALEWDFSGGLTFSLLRGNQNERRENLKLDADIYLINYELLNWLVQERKKTGLKLDFQMVVYDELSKLANIKSKVHKAAKVFNKVEYRLGLTGTPVGNSLINLFGEMYAIDSGESLGDSFYNFRELYFESNPYTPYVWKPKQNAKQHIFRAIADRCFTYIPANRPKPAYFHLPCLLPNNSLCLIDDIADDGVLDDMILRSPDISNKISQIESGFYYHVDDYGMKRTVYDNDVKIKRVINLRENLEGEPLLVFFRYEEDFNRLVNLGASTKNTPGFIKKWNSGEIDFLALHPASVGHGVNLQKGGCNILFYGLPWSVELFQQCIGRLLRIGQEKQVSVYWFNTPQERVIFNALKDRKNVEVALENYLKNR